MKLLAAIGATLALVVFAPPASSSGARAARLFSISRFENRNFVRFAEHVDGACGPTGDAPVFAYWRMLERDAARTEPLLLHEQPV